MPRYPAPGAVRAALPQAQQPQLAILATDAPQDDGWISEIKFDGYRLLVAADGDNVRLLTRSGLDWTDRMPGVRNAMVSLRLRSALLDGGLVALDANQRRFQLPHAPGGFESGQDASLVYYAFDLLRIPTEGGR